MTIIWHHGPALPTGWPDTLPAWWEAARARAAGAVVLVEAGRAWTWDELLDTAGRLAQTWAEQVPADTRIALRLPNGAAHLIVELAAWHLGAAAAPIPPHLGPVATADLLARLAPVLVVEAAAEVLATRTNARLPPRPVSGDTAALVLATSGSSGHPKAVVLSHRNLTSQQAAFALQWPEIGPGDRLAAYLPWHHSFGALAERLWALGRGATLTVVPGAGRDREVLLATMHAVRPTVLMSVPKVHRLLRTADALDHACLRWVFTAGASLGSSEDAWYAARGIPIHEGWGLTESSPSATLTVPGDARTPGVVGRPIAGVAVGVRADGHVLIAGPNVMTSYLGDAAATAQVRWLDPQLGPVLDSGDLGEWSPAGLRLLGRADQTIKLGNGEKVALAAIAARLEAQPGIQGAVVHSPDGEHLEAVVQARDDACVQAALVAVNASEPTPWRRLRSIRCLSLTPSVDNGLLTPSLKPVPRTWIASLID